MDAVVLVGGFGTRLRPLTSETPKQMLPIGHVTMLEVVLARLAAQGITRAVLSLGYRPEVFRERWPDARIGGLEVDYAVDPYPLDTAGAIRFAAVQAGIADTFVAINGDVITSLDVRTQIDRHRAAGVAATMHLVSVDDPSRFGVVSIDEANQVIGFVEKPPRHEAPSNLINAGTYVLEPRVLDLIPDGEAVSIERATFPALVARGELNGFHQDGYWVDAGTPETYLQVNLDALTGAWSDPIDPIGDGASVDSTAVIDQAVVGSDATVGPYASIRRSVLMEGATIAEGAQVSDSIIGSGATVAAGASIAGHSMVGPHVVVPSGAVLEGARVPEAD
jgi:mannose-1-phosphate guanylyltransferase